MKLYCVECVLERGREPPFIGGVEGALWKMSLPTWKAPNRPLNCHCRYIEPGSTSQPTFPRSNGTAIGNWAHLEPAVERSRPWSHRTSFVAKSAQIWWTCSPWLPELGHGGDLWSFDVFMWVLVQPPSRLGPGSSGGRASGWIWSVAMVGVGPCLMWKWAYFVPSLVLLWAKMEFDFLLNFFFTFGPFLVYFHVYPSKQGNSPKLVEYVSDKPYIYVLVLIWLDFMWQMAVKSMQ